MKKIWKTRKDREGVSPVIATILMVAITVVLAAVLYVMVMGMSDGPPRIPQPLGLNDGGKTSTTLTLLISSASDRAKVEGTMFSFTQGNDITSIDNATLYGGDGLEAAWYTPSEGWKYGSGHDADTLKFDAGMKLKVTVNSGVSSGDELTINSKEDYFLPTTYEV